MLTSVFSLVLASTDARAHKPFFGPGYTSAQDALYLDDPDISIALYQTLTCDQPQVWIEFDAEPGYEVWISLGVPEIERLEGYRPSLAVVAAGLPEADLGFALPAGTGAVVFDTAELDDVGAFYEPFTQTNSWVLAEELVVLPEGGPAWVMAWDPAGWTGKVWVAVGTVEDFSDLDGDAFASMSETVNNFHETGRYEEPPDIEEVQCDLEQDDTAPVSEADGADTGSTGCATGPGAGLFGVMFGLGAVARRRRSLR